MTFKLLPIGAEFEFDHSDLPCSCGGMEHGPWRKASARMYFRRIGNEIMRLKYHHQVVSINAAVRTDGTCGGK